MADEQRSKDSSDTRSISDGGCQAVILDIAERVAVIRWLDH